MSSASPVFNFLCAPLLLISSASRAATATAAVLFLLVLVFVFGQLPTTEATIYPSLCHSPIAFGVRLPKSTVTIPLASVPDFGFCEVRIFNLNVLKAHYYSSDCVAAGSLRKDVVFDLPDSLAPCESCAMEVYVHDPKAKPKSVVRKFCGSVVFRYAAPFPITPSVNYTRADSIYAYPYDGAHHKVQIGAPFIVKTFLSLKNYTAYATLHDGSGSAVLENGAVIAGVKKNRTVEFLIPAETRALEFGTIHIRFVLEDNGGQIIQLAQTVSLVKPEPCTPKKQRVYIRLNEKRTFITQGLVHKCPTNCKAEIYDHLNDLHTTLDSFQCPKRGAPISFRLGPSATACINCILKITMVEYCEDTKGRGVITYCRKAEIG